MSELGSRIREARTRATMSQAHLAAAAGLSERTVKRAEAGEGLSAETLRALSAALAPETFGMPDAAPRERVLYTSLVPPPVPVEVGGPTGLLTLADDPVRLGVEHGVLTGLSLPGTCRSAEGFLEEFGPDNLLTAEAQTASAFHRRIFWIDRALHKATDPADRKAAEALRIEAQGLVLEAEREEARALARHFAWSNVFRTASLLAHMASRAVQVAACGWFGWLLGPNPLAAALAAVLLFLAVGFAATVGIVLRFDRGEARARRNRLIEERTYREGRQILAVHASGLTP